MLASYTPGHFVGAVGRYGAFLTDLDPGFDGENLLVEALDTNHPLSLPALASGVTAFAIAMLDGGGVRLHLWGGTTAIVGIHGRAKVLSGSGRAEWTEHRLVDGEGVVLGDTTAPKTALEPIASGTLRAGSIRMGSAARQSARADMTTDPQSTPVDTSPELLFSELWGQTMRRPVEDAAVRESGSAGSDAGPKTTPDSAPLPGSGDINTVGRPIDEVGANPQGHESGQSVLIDALPWRVFPTAEPPLDLAGIEAHDGRTVPRRELLSTSSVSPAVRVRCSAGAVVDVVSSLIIGRSPKAEDVPDAAVLEVESPGLQISRSHVCLRRNGDSLQATDLASENGTRLIRAGMPAVPLMPRVGVELRAGDVIDVGDGVTLHIEAPPGGVST